MTRFGAVKGSALGAVVLVVALAAAWLTFPGTPASAGAVDRWTEPLKVSRDVSSEWDVAMGAGGRAAVVWYGERDLMVALRSRQGEWSPPRAVAAADHNGYDLPPAVAMNDRGTVVIAFQNKHRLLAVRKPARSGWQKPHLLRRNPVPFAHLSVALSRKGEATVAMIIGGDEGDVYAVRSRSDGRRWQRPRLMGHDGGTADVVTAPGGAVTVAWWCETHVCVRSHQQGSRWSGISRVVETNVSGLELAVDLAGRVYLVSGGGITIREPGGRWHQSDVRLGGWGWHVAAAGRGWAVATFMGERGRRGYVSVAIRCPDGRWTAKRVWKTAHVYDASSVIDPHGRVAVTWSGHWDVTKVHVAHHRPGSRWTPPLALGRGTEARINISPSGETLVTYGYWGVWASTRRHL